jgi:hypothetical protein
MQIIPEKSQKRYWFDSNLSIHDFRLVRKFSKSTILFDIVVPFNYCKTNEEILNYIKDKFLPIYPAYEFLVEFDNIYLKKR